MGWRVGLVFDGLSARMDGWMVTPLDGWMFGASLNDAELQWECWFADGGLVRLLVGQ